MSEISSTTATGRITAIIRISGRARHMRLVASPSKGLELVAPRGTTRAQMQDFLASNAAWAARKLLEFGAPLDARESLATVLPDEMHLRAVGENWAITYELRLESEIVSLQFRQNDGEHRVLVCHPKLTERELYDCTVELLTRYLRARARHELSLLMRKLAHETGLQAPSRIRIGMQNTLWGSRSSSGTISLSARLLFLEPELVRHVLIHELCHTVHMNHGAAFQILLQKHDPQSAIHSARLRGAALSLPPWIRN